MTIKMACLNCSWWTSSASDDMKPYMGGKCRLRAPQVVQTGGAGYEHTYETVWVVTEGNDFCGEFKEASQ